MKRTIKFSFYCRPSKIDRKGEAPVELSLVLNGKRVILQLPFRCKPADFNRKRQPEEIQQYLEAQRTNINRILAEMLSNSVPLTIDTLKDYMKTGGIKSYTIQNLFDEFLALQKMRVGKTLTKAVYKKYIATCEHFKEEIDFRNECTAITPALIQGYYYKLQNKYQDATSCGMMTRLKAVIRFGMDNEHIKINPFQGIKITKGEKDVTTITEDDLRAILDHKFTPRVQRVADMFLFACGSGLAYTDCVSLVPSDFVEKDGAICIGKKRNKTGVKYLTVLMPWAEDIVRKYNFDFSALQISNQKTNAYLKEVQDLCGINITLHFHLARHFYAMYLLNQNVPITTVSKILGHTNLRTTQHYAKTLEQTILDDIKKLPIMQR